MIKHIKTRSNRDVLSEQTKQSRSLVKEQFAGKLYKLMLAKGWRQADLARASDLPRDFISTYLKGTSLPSSEKVAALAKALGVEPSELSPNYDVSSGVDRSQIEMKVDPKNPARTFLQISRHVSTTTALKIIELINADGPADGK